MDTTLFDRAEDMGLTIVETTSESQSHYQQDKTENRYSIKTFAQQDCK